MKILEDTETFMRAAGQLDNPGFPEKWEDPVRQLRRDLALEEHREYIDGEKKSDPVEVADGLIDMIVIYWGTMLAYLGPEEARATRAKEDKFRPQYTEKSKIGFPPEPNSIFRKTRKDLSVSSHLLYVHGEDKSDLGMITGTLMMGIEDSWTTLVLYFGPELAEELANSVGESNLSKIRPDGTVVKREDGKILKPDGYFPPRIREILIEHRVLPA